ncbi:MAG TPA: DUF4197 domain-containing protein [Salinimicrobium sp.]|nr:DUF4197 domain-containing protein [Salinimicrobium sp.]
MKKIIALLAIFGFCSCAELQTIADNMPQTGVFSSDADIAAGLRQALDQGIEEQVTKLTQENGFYGNNLVKILLPTELQKVDQTLRDFGLGDLADEGLKVLNRAAEDAVKEATPIFVDAVKGITFSDAKNILLGNDTAATNYLERQTSAVLYSKFNPQIKTSLDKVGANQIWSNIIQKYNSLPLTSDVNPDLTDYVTQEALEGVFTMIAVEEKDIRNNISARTTDLLRRIFAMQDHQ